MKKILVIDDQPSLLEIVSVFLSNEGFDVATAATGLEGLELAHTWLPDLILCDVMMPDVNGYDVLAATRQSIDLATTPFVFLTAKASASDRRQGMLSGADDYLTKPFSAEELLAAVQAQIKKNTLIRDRYQQKIDFLRQGLSMILPHELKTPLTLILAHTSLLLEAGKELDHKETQEMIQVVHDSGMRLHRTLENLLIYATTDSGSRLRLEQPEATSIRDAVLSTARSRAKAYQRNDDLVTSVQDAQLTIHPFHFRKIVEELVDNAFKFSHPGHPVRLEVRSDGDTLHLVIEDRGRGMSVKQIRHVDAYVQFNRYIFEQQGAGMGLIITKRLVELYDGAMDITSETRRGTRVQVRLPKRWPVTLATGQAVGSGA